MPFSPESYAVERLLAGAYTAPAADFVLVFAATGEIQVAGPDSQWVVAASQVLALGLIAKVPLRVQAGAASEGYIVRFREGFFSVDALNKRLLLNPRLFPPTPRGPFTPDGWASISQLLGLLHQEAAGGTGNEEIIRGLLRVLLLKLDVGAKPSGFAFDFNQALNLQFQELVTKNYRHLNGAKAYADHLNVTVRQLKRAVKAATGESACGFATQRFLAEATRLLLHSPSSVKEVAYELGFTDPYYFSRYFKRYAHQSPAQFRKEHALTPGLTLVEELGEAVAR